MMRVMWRQSLDPRHSNNGRTQLLTEAYFSARIVLTAQVLQALVYLCMHQEEIDQNINGINDNETLEEMHDFNHVQSLDDASM
ncbi:hypothetical protein CCR75_002914 [Bremia lactucae]|uniref:Uncharacterized protein n=1 Tax=Bremia lactucae TaxID=4779 RepID=A0A976FPD6_BRELC|nr:hypothetical protein CCR75_002914 [Bremia lactucae]